MIQITLNQIYNSVKEYLYLEDTKLIDTILAICCSRLQQNSKLWLIIIGRSGDGKTELLKLIDDEGQTTKTLKTLTPNTLVNGYLDKKRYPDLAPKLKNKIVLLPEMAQIISLHPEAMRQVWSQLRDLYDGEAGKISGDGCDILYKDLNVTFIGCSTPAIENKALVNQNLGTRELLYRTEDKDDEELMNRIIQNSSINKNEFRNNLRNMLLSFIHSKKYNAFEIDKNVLKEIREWAYLTSQLRVVVPLESRNGEIIGEVSPEAPTRILEQFVTLYRCLKCLDSNYDDKRALSIIKKISQSSCPKLRMEILFLMLWRDMYYENGLSRRDVGKELNISKDTAYGELNILTALGILQRIDKPIDVEKEQYYTKFRINPDNNIVKHLTRIYSIDRGLVVKEETI